MESLSERPTCGPAARLLILIMVATAIVGAVTTWVAVNYATLHTDYWPAYNDMMASMPSP